jgi:histidinol-phosphate aminotransferase
LTDAFASPDPRVKLIYLPNPNSPTGTFIDHESILALADKMPCPIVVDEAYVDFAPKSAVSLVKENPKIIVTRTLSKSYALAGLRFGFLVAHPEIVRTLCKVKDSYNTDALSLAGATAAITDQAWLRNNVSRIRQTRDRMTISMRGLGFAVLDSHANFIWCTRADRPTKPIYEQLKTRGILVRYMNYPNWSDGLRISVGTDEQIEALLVVLKDIL